MVANLLKKYPKIKTVLAHNVLITLLIIFLQLPITGFVFYVAAEIIIIAIFSTYLTSRSLFKILQYKKNINWKEQVLLNTIYILLCLILLVTTIAINTFNIIVAVTSSLIIFIIEQFSLYGSLHMTLADFSSNRFALLSLLIAAGAFLYSHLRQVLILSQNYEEAENYFRLEMHARLKVLLVGLTVFLIWAFCLLLLQGLKIPSSFIAGPTMVYLFSLAVLAHKIYWIDLRFIHATVTKLRLHKLQVAKKDVMKRYLI